MNESLTILPFLDVVVRFHRDHLGVDELLPMESLAALVQSVRSSLPKKEMHEQFSACNWHNELRLAIWRNSFQV